jgi:hypothetical protein
MAEQKIYIEDNEEQYRKARLFLLDRMHEHVPHDFNYPKDMEDDEIEYSEKVTNYIKKCKRLRIKGLDMLRRGDAIKFSEEVDRNDTLCFWDGEKAVSADYSNRDEYGEIPVCFNVLSEFPINFWDNVRNHNNMVPFSPQIGQLSTSISEKILALKNKNIITCPKNKKNSACRINIPVIPNDVMDYNEAYIVFLFETCEITRMKELILDRLSSRNTFIASDKQYEFEDHIPTNLSKIIQDIPEDKILWIHIPNDKRESDEESDEE